MQMAVSDRWLVPDKLRQARRQRGISMLDGVACALATLGIAIVTALLLADPEPDPQASSPVSDAMVFLAGSGQMYRQAEANAQIYLDMLNSAGPLAQALDGVGGLPDPTAAQGLQQMFNLQAAQP